MLKGAGVVRSVGVGREGRLEPEPIDDVRADLAQVSDQWDRALARLKSFVEDDAT